MEPDPAEYVFDTALIHPMQPIDDRSHLADVRPIASSQAGRVLTLGWKLMLNASLLLMPVGMVVVLFIPIFGLALLIGTSQSLLLAAVAIPVVLVAQVTWAGTYPEWPMNQLLLWRLRRACRSRLGDQYSDWIDQARMVEWVPRENWSATKLDTAEDVMLMRVDESGVRMEGDFFQYDFPSASIIDAEFESIRPTGCFHSLHFMVITVRTPDGPMEFPIAFRDHKLGQLRSRHRYQQTHELCQSIRSVATGGDFSYVDPAHRGVAVPAGRVTAANAGSANPYAAPRAL